MKCKNCPSKAKQMAKTIPMKKAKTKAKQMAKKVKARVPKKITRKPTNFVKRERATIDRAKKKVPLL